MSAKQTIWQCLNPTVEAEVIKISSWIAQQESNSFSVNIIQIENMPSILFSYGEQISMEVTERVGDVIKDALPKNSFVTRLGVQDFIYLTPYTDEKNVCDSATLVADKLRFYSIEQKKHPVFFKTRIGSSVYTKGDDVDKKFDEAYIALFESLHSESKPHIMYSHSSVTMKTYQQEMQTAAMFLDILEKKQFKLAFQPVVHSKTGKVKSYEVLLRIIGENGELKSPGLLIIAAEQYGFVDKVDLIILDQAVKELINAPDISLGINVSMRSIDNSIWINKAKKLLKDPDVASRLIVEITETGIQDDIKKIIKFVDDVQSLGCLVAIDDFGAGYTSFVQLKEVKADILKIDGVFIKNLNEDKHNQMLVQTLVTFAKSFGLKTVAEFVENGEIAKILINMGVDYLQGHYFSKALSNRPWYSEFAVHDDDND